MHKREYMTCTTWRDKKGWIHVYTLYEFAYFCKKEKQETNEENGREPIPSIPFCKALTFEPRKCLIFPQIKRK